MPMTMTSLTRVRKAVHFDSPDRIAHHLPDGGHNDVLWLWMGGVPPKSDWTNHGDVDRMTDAWGTTFQRVAGGVIGRGETLVGAITDITYQADLEFPDKNHPDRFAAAGKQIISNSQAADPKYCLGVMPFSSLNEGTHNLMGLENMFAAYYEHPADLKALISRLAASQRESIRQLHRIGCHGVMGYDDWGLQDGPMVSTDLLDEFFMPHYQQNWALAHSLGMDVWLHSCGHILSVLDRFIDAGLNVVQMDQQENMGLENINAQVGGRIAFWCPVDIQRTMVDGSPADVAAYVRKMVDTVGAHHGGLVSMAYSSPDDVKHSPENMAAMCAAFRNYGVYDDQGVAQTS